MEPSEPSRPVAEAGIKLVGGFTITLVLAALVYAVAIGLRNFPHIGV